MKDHSKGSKFLHRSQLQCHAALGTTQLSTGPVKIPILSNFPRSKQRVAVMDRLKAADLLRHVRMCAVLAIEVRSQVLR